MDSTSFSWDYISHHTLLEKSWYLGRMSLSWSDCKVTLIEYLAGVQNRGDVTKFSLAEWQQLKKLSLSQATYCLAWSNVFFFTMAPWSYLVPKINFSWALNNQSLLLFISQPTNDLNMDDLDLQSLWETTQCPHIWVRAMRCCSSGPQLWDCSQMLLFHMDEEKAEKSTSSHLRSNCSRCLNQTTNPTQNLALE